MIFYRVPSIEPSYRINGVDLYTLSELQDSAAEMQRLQIERLTKQREWQGLTDDEIEQVRIATFTEFQKHLNETGSAKRDPAILCRAIEAKLREKNSE